MCYVSIIYIYSNDSEINDENVEKIVLKEMIENYDMINTIALTVKSLWANTQFTTAKTFNSYYRQNK